MLGDGWRGIEVAADARDDHAAAGRHRRRRQPPLAPLGRKIGPDPASIDAAMIGGIAANNASGMCCGTAQNSYHTLAGLRVVLADGTVLDTRDAASRAEFARSCGPSSLEGLAELARGDARGRRRSPARIRHKFRLKNTTGYSLNALVDFSDPFDILAHLMIGSEGTLGFISEITYHTVEEHAAQGERADPVRPLETACSAVTRLKPTPVAAVELLDRASLRSVEDKPGMPECCAPCPPTARPCWSRRAPRPRPRSRVKIDAIAAALGTLRDLFAPLRFATDAAEAAALWNVRKGMFPAVGAMRPTGTTVIIEDVAFPIERLADATLDLQRLLHRARLPRGDHLRPRARGQPPLRLHPGLRQRRRDRALPPLHGRDVQRWSSTNTTARSRPSTAPDATWRPFVELEWGAQAVAADARASRRCSTRRGCSIPGVILNDDPLAHLKT